jgi:hypothetical protein
MTWWSRPMSTGIHGGGWRMLKGTKVKCRCDLPYFTSGSRKENGCRGSSRVQRKKYGQTLHVVSRPKLKYIYETSHFTVLEMLLPAIKLLRGTWPCKSKSLLE